MAVCDRDSDRLQRLKELLIASWRRQLLEGNDKGR
jgi:hypothetical protein